MRRGGCRRLTRRRREGNAAAVTPCSSSRPRRLGRRANGSAAWQLVRIVGQPSAYYCIVTDGGLTCFELIQSALDRRLSNEKTRHALGLPGRLNCSALPAAYSAMSA